jgi:hypothetical protein
MQNRRALILLMISRCVLRRRDNQHESLHDESLRHESSRRESLRCKQQVSAVRPRAKPLSRDVEGVQPRCITFDACNLLVILSTLVLQMGAKGTARIARIPDVLLLAKGTF